jgi:hypothetical protein
LRRGIRPGVRPELSPFLTVRVALKRLVAVRDCGSVILKAKAGDRS